MFTKDLFNDQVALVTGGRSGIGFAIAKTMLQSGAKVMIAARKEEPLQEAAAELKEWGKMNSRISPASVGRNP